MDLTALLLRVGARRPHVLLVPTPGWSRTRLALEAEIARRAWPVAASPADTDVLVVAGVAGPAMTGVVDAMWAQVPAPRVLVTIAEPDDVSGALDGAARALADAPKQRGAAEHARDRTVADKGRDDEPNGNGASATDQHVHEHTGHGEHDAHGGHDSHSGHHDHQGGMSLPGGLAMADLGDDRDGLKLDQLHVTLGPVLPDWPAGLVVRVTLQGDVIQEASAEVLDPIRRHEEGQSVPAVVRELDGLARFLAVAGWSDAAARSRRLRDRLAVDPGDGRVAGEALTLLSRVQRSRVLRWSLRGVRAGPIELAQVLEQRLTRSRAVLEGTPSGPSNTRAVDELSTLLVGAEFAAARLILAAVDLQTEPRRVEESTHG